MRATEELQKCPGTALDSMHALRSRLLPRAVQATIRGRRLTLMDLARAWPHADRVLAPLKARDRLLGNRHLHAERESIPALALTARRMVSLYAKRMQIELSFRDLKSHRYGQASEDSLTRKGARIEVLLLLSAMAALATWLVGMACEARGIDRWLTPFRSRRRLYSVMRLGLEALLRGWLHIPLDRLIAYLKHPASTLSDQWGAPA